MDNADATWLQDRFIEHLDSVCRIEEAIRQGRITEAGMDIVQLRHMLNLNIDRMRKLSWNS